MEVREIWFKHWLLHLLAAFVLVRTCLRTLFPKFSLLYCTNNFFLSACCSIYQIKSSIYPTSLSNLYPISLLPVTAKFLDKDVYIHCFYFLSTSLLNYLQSGFHLYYPIKIAPLKVTNKLPFSQIKYDHFWVLILLYIASAFCSNHTDLLVFLKHATHVSTLGSLNSCASAWKILSGYQNGLPLSFPQLSAHMLSPQRALTHFFVFLTNISICYIIILFD